jgi:biotin carboxyl carrier protein
LEAIVTQYEITVNGNKFIVEVGDISKSPVQVIVNGEPKMVEFAESAAPATTVAAPVPVVAAPVAKVAPAPAPAPTVGAKPVVAPMPGKILSCRVRVGDKVIEGDTVCTLEAMKMEMPISSTISGTVQAIHVNVGDSVAYNDPLVTVA